MLLELSIKNVALIDQLRIEFEPGLNVLTGETGAGKSIVIDSVNLVLGQRANKELIRTGASAANVQALFLLGGNAAILNMLDELGIKPEEDYLIISRELNQNGRSVCRIDGEVVPLAKFKQITELLVDVHGQHEHQALLRPSLHLEYVDAYGNAAHRALIDAVKAAYNNYTAIKQEIERLSVSALERERRIDMLNYQIREIEEIAPIPGEDEKLEQRNRLMKNAEMITGSVKSAYKHIYGGEGQKSSAQELLKRAQVAMSQISGIDERFDSIAARIEEMYYQVQDIGYELGDIGGELEYDPNENERIEDRLSDLKKLKRKYGPELVDVLSFLEQCKVELDELDEGEDRIQSLRAQETKQLEALTSASKDLSDSRKAIALEFEQMLLGQLKDLGMARTRFEVRFDESKPNEQRLSANGWDRVEFMISPNPGEPLKQLSAIASGGEMARIMLAMKAVSSNTTGVDTMIFDEIDTGVSGRMAQVVGEKMAEVASGRQVICVTHLPQIAALGEAHYLVEKTVVEDRTGSNVRRLAEDGRVGELSRLLSGAGDIEGGKAYARGMLDAAQEWLRKRQAH